MKPGRRIPITIAGAALIGTALLLGGCSTATKQESMPGMSGQHQGMNMGGSTQTAGGSSSAAPASGSSSILTTKALRQLPAALKETDEIKLTGQTREYTLDIKEGKWELVKGTMADAITINGTVPGPTIRATEGDNLKITVKNNLKEVTSIHWHGLHVPYLQDGVAPINMLPIKPGEQFTFQFPANHAGTFMYHSHSLVNEIEQIDRGMYGAIIIDPQDPAAQPKYNIEKTMVLGGWTVGNGSMPGMSMNYNYWTINGKSFPDIEPIKVKTGDRVRIRLINISNLAHPMHLHGTDFRTIAVDGHPVAQPQIMNTINVEPGKTYDIEFIADNPGVWVFHCHELHHTTNDDKAPGGLIQVIQYEGYDPIGMGAEPAAPSSKAGGTPEMGGMSNLPGTQGAQGAGGNMGDMEGMGH